jgi:hypothetical protein
LGENRVEKLRQASRKKETEFKIQHSEVATERVVVKREELSKIDKSGIRPFCN